MRSSMHWLHYLYGKILMLSFLGFVLLQLG